MTDRPYNPPAFPCDYEIGREVEYDERLGQNVIRQLLEKRPGMDLRDYLAGLALEGCVEKQFSDALLARLGSTEAVSAAIAGAAYQIADACLLARRGGVDPMFAAVEQRDRLLEVARHARETAITVLGECECENPPKWAETLLRMVNAVLPPDPEES